MHCNADLGGYCKCFRPDKHFAECACTCTLYGSVHGTIAVPAGVAGVLVTDQPWTFNARLKRQALVQRSRE